MTEHLAGCWAKVPSDPEAWCTCEELRFLEERVREAEKRRNLGEKGSSMMGQDHFTRGLWIGWVIGTAGMTIPMIVLGLK